MTNNQLEEKAEEFERDWPFITPSMSAAYKEGFTDLSMLIIQHLKTLPLDTMTGKQVEESLFTEFLHIQ